MVYITYTMATSDLPDIYAQAQGPQAQGRGHIYIRKIPSGHGITIKYHTCFTAHIKVSIVAVKFIPYFTGSSEKVVIVISLARIYVNNVVPISVYTCLIHSDKLRT